MIRSRDRRNWWMVIFNRPGVMTVGFDFPIRGSLGVQNVDLSSNAPNHLAIGVRYAMTLGCDLIQQSP